MAAITSLRIELFRSAPRNSDNTPLLIESAKAMTSDPRDAGSLDVRRTVLGLETPVAFFKFLASIIALSKTPGLAALKYYTTDYRSAPVGCNRAIANLKRCESLPGAIVRGIRTEENHPCQLKSFYYRSLFWSGSLLHFCWSARAQVGVFAASIDARGRSMASLAGVLVLLAMWIYFALRILLLI